MLFPEIPKEDGALIAIRTQGSVFNIFFHRPLSESADAALHHLAMGGGGTSVAPRQTTRSLVHQSVGFPEWVLDVNILHVFAGSWGTPALLSLSMPPNGESKLHP